MSLLPQRHIAPGSKAFLYNQKVTVRRVHFDGWVAVSGDDGEVFLVHGPQLVFDEEPPPNPLHPGDKVSFRGEFVRIIRMGGESALVQNSRGHVFGVGVDELLLAPVKKEENGTHTT